MDCIHSPNLTGWYKFTANTIEIAMTTFDTTSFILNLSRDTYSEGYLEFCTVPSYSSESYLLVSCHGCLLSPQSMIFLQEPDLFV